MLFWLIPAIIVGIVIILILWPFRIVISILLDENGVDGFVHIHPLLGLKILPIKIWESDTVKKAKKSKRQKSQSKPKKKDPKYEAESNQKKFTSGDVMPLISDILELLYEARNGVQKVPVRIDFAYSMKDPALTGNLTGAIYAALPFAFGYIYENKWRVRLNPDWCDKFYIQLNVESLLSVAVLLRAFWGTITKVFPFYRKLKKHSEEKNNE